MARKSIGKVVKQLCHALRQRHNVKEKPISGISFSLFISKVTVHVTIRCVLYLQ